MIFNTEITDFNILNLFGWIIHEVGYKDRPVRSISPIKADEDFNKFFEGFIYSDKDGISYVDYNLFTFEDVNTQKLRILSKKLNELRFSTLISSSPDLVILKFIIRDKVTGSHCATRNSSLNTAIMFAVYSFKELILERQHMKKLLSQV